MTRKDITATALDRSQNVNYCTGMVIVTKRHLEDAGEKYPEAAKEIAAWKSIVGKVQWKNFIELRASFPDADVVNGYVVFNIRRNQYRLITVVHYSKATSERKTRGHVYIRSFLTHKQYDDPNNWDKEFGT